MAGPGFDHHELAWEGLRRDILRGDRDDVVVGRQTGIFLHHRLNVHQHRGRVYPRSLLRGGSMGING